MGDQAGMASIGRRRICRDKMVEGAELNLEGSSLRKQCSLSELKQPIGRQGGPFPRRSSEHSGRKAV